MGAVAAIILLFICLIGSRNETVYKVIIAIICLIGIGLLIAGCVTGFGYGIWSGLFILLVGYFLVYVVSGCTVSIFTLFDDIGGTWELYPASKKAVAARKKHLEEIKAHSKERAVGRSIPTHEDLEKFHGWEIPKTPDEIRQKMFRSYGRRWDTICWDNVERGAKMLIEDYSSEFYDTTVRYKKEKDWYIILCQIGKQEYETRRERKFEDAEKTYGFRLPRTPLDFVKEYAYMKKDAKICETYRRSGEVIMEDENSPFYPDSPYYEGGKPTYENKEEFIEACVQWREEGIKKEERIARIKAEMRKDEELRRAIESYK